MTASWPCPGTPHRGHAEPTAPCPLVPVEVELAPPTATGDAPLRDHTHGDPDDPCLEVCYRRGEGLPPDRPNLELAEPLDRWTTVDGGTVEVYRHPDAGRPNVSPDTQLVRFTPPPLDRSRWDPSPGACYPAGPPRDPLREPRDALELAPGERARLAAIRARAPWYDVAPRVGAVEAFYDVAFLLDLVDRLTRPTTDDRGGNRG